MRQGRVIDGSVRTVSASGTAKRDRIIHLIRDLAADRHHTGRIQDHADPSVTDDWKVNGIETCRDVLCIDALDTIKDIQEVLVHFPLDSMTTDPDAGSPSPAPTGARARTRGRARA